MIKDPACKNKTYRMNDLDAIISSEISKLALDPQYVRQLQEHKPAQDQKNIEDIQKQITSTSKKLSRLLDLYAEGICDLDDLSLKAKELNDHRESLKEDLARLQAHSTIPEAEVITAARSFADAMQHGSLSEKRLIIQQLINRIDIDGDQITIHWNFT